MSELWVWIEDLDESGPRTLSSEEARHVTARRLRRGDGLVVFDAKGKLASARVADPTRRAVRVEVGEIRSASAPECRFGLASAIPKGERLSTLLQMATQLGLEVWQPLVLEHSVVRKLEIDSPRLQRILIESCKLARRPWAMRVLPPVGLEAAIEAREPGTPLFYGDREGAAEPFDRATGWGFIGPEAGFSEAEQGHLQAAEARALSFGDYNLRIETAVLAAAASFNRDRSHTRGVSPDRVDPKGMLDVIG